jgi:hypothetical protein
MAPTLSEAAAATLTVPDTIEPADGDVTETIGAVVSGGTATENAIARSLGFWLPAESRQRT